MTAENKQPVGRVAKAPTGIRGLDEITFGGLPQGRPTLICGGAGSGKTLLALEFLARGAIEFDEPGLFVGFEETAEELSANFASLGFDLDELVAAKKLYLDHVKFDHVHTVEAGEFDLEGLFIRLGRAIDLIGARRVALDTIESLFARLPNPVVLRAELQRLFRWFKGRGVTVVMTGERGGGLHTHSELEEFVSDCVITLDHRVVDAVSTRRLRIVKYRGSAHGTNEYPFLIDDRGISVLPITSLGLGQQASQERVSTGIPRLDMMLGGRGYFRGSSILISGTSGTGKSSVAATFADATCRRGERCLYLAFEESQSQIIRNMRSIGLDLEPWTVSGNLHFSPLRPASIGLEMHLNSIHRQVADFHPDAVIIDPISSFMHSGSPIEAGNVVLRIVDFLKSRQITALLTNLVAGGTPEKATDLNISSLIDTWLLLREVELGGERNRVIDIVKSRGMSHSNQIREFRLTDRGIELVDVYSGPKGVLTGTMRLAQEAKEADSDRRLMAEVERKKSLLEYKRRLTASRIDALRLDLEAEEQEIRAVILEADQQQERLKRGRVEMSASRGADHKGSVGQTDGAVQASVDEPAQSEAPVEGEPLRQRDPS